MHFEARQAGAEIIAHLVPPEAARELVKDYSLPPGFGFTFISSVHEGERFVLVHWGLGGSERDGLRLESPMLIPIFQEIFDEARHRSEEYRGPTTSEPAKGE